MSERLLLKPVRALSWGDVDDRDATLVARCVSGDENACADLVSEHQRMVYQLALNLLGEHHEALDLSQEIFLSVFRALGSFRGQSTLRTWIYRIAVNHARNRLRWWNRRFRSSQVSLDDHIRHKGEFATEAVNALPEQALGRKLLAARLRAALTQLPFEQRTAIILREIDGLSYEEIAFSLGIAVGTVKSRLARAREALRAQLRDA